MRLVMALKPRHTCYAGRGTHTDTQTQIYQQQTLQVVCLSSFSAIHRDDDCINNLHLLSLGKIRFRRKRRLQYRHVFSKNQVKLQRKKVHDVTSNPNKSICLRSFIYIQMFTQSKRNVRKHHWINKLIFSLINQLCNSWKKRTALTNTMKVKAISNLNLN